MGDLDILIDKFLVPMESNLVCDELIDHGFDSETTETWCSRNCGVVNDGTCPSKECYLEYIKMVKADRKTDKLTDAFFRTGLYESEPLKAYGIDLAEKFGNSEQVEIVPEQEWKEIEGKVQDGKIT